MAGAYASFEALIQQLMSADNAARSSAEKAFGQLAEQQPDALATELLTILCNSTADLGSRSESAILMRRVSRRLRPPALFQHPTPISLSIPAALSTILAADISITVLKPPQNGHPTAFIFTKIPSPAHDTNSNEF
jgi:hypothetical protein